MASSPLSSPPTRTVPLKGAFRSTSRPSTPALISPPTSPPLRPQSGLFPRTLTGGSRSAGYTPKVGFDTFETPNDDALFSLTLQVKSEGYRRNRNTRIFLCAASADESGRHALEWVLESLVQDGDELVVVRGFDVPDCGRDMHDEVRDDAKDLSRQIQEKNREVDETRKLSIIVEFVVGRVTETIERMIALYRPDSLVVGTKGEPSLLQAWGAALGAPRMGSVSRYCLSHSPVPVIVVQPEHKVRKTMEKRRADPKRKTQFDELSRSSSQPRGNHTP